MLLETCELLIRHAEGEGVHVEARLPAAEGLAREAVDLLGERVGHGVAAGRLAVAVHHQGFAGAVPGAVVGVGIAEVERQVELEFGFICVCEIE